MKRGELSRKTPLRSKSGLKQGGRLKPTGKRRERELPAIRAAYAEVDKRNGGICEAPYCRAPATDHHHLQRRTAAPQNIADPDNLVGLCRGCHDRVDRDRAWAIKNKLHFYSWEEDAMRAAAGDRGQ